MKINSNKRFTLDSFPSEVRSWIFSLTGSLNAFIEETILAVNKGLTTEDNFKCQKIALSITANQLYPIRQAYSLNERPYSVHIANIRESTGAVLSAAYSLHWEFINGYINITLIGLDSSKNYTVHLIAQV